MGSKIFKLSEEVINQIAAGEVVENPASIVKELIENSLDAGAQTISVAIEGGGSLLLQVEDDGFGMGREDAKNCLERYATSKIRSTQDLESLQTMGFRGEALAAIASVSRLSLKTNDGLEGTSIQVEGGAISSVQPCARNRGTTIEVRSLFFNTPARKKFLKSNSANAALVRRVVEMLALAHPEVVFSLASHGEIILETVSQGMKERVEKILGSMAAQVSTPLIQGFLASPEEAKSHRRDQYLFINRRPIFSPLISKAVKRGYGTRLAENSHPGFALFLTISPEDIDVNVHPQKKEVRFSDEQKIFRLFERCVSAAFQGEMESFASPLAFTAPSFSFKEEPLPWMSEKIQETPLEFNFPISERPLAVIHHFFLLEREGVLMVDLQRAHARVLFENLREKKGEIQNLLVPLEIFIEEGDAVDELLELGIECREIGKSRVAIDGLPSWLEPSSFDRFFAAWKKGKKIEDAAMNYCRGLKKKYTFEEARSLWKALCSCREQKLDPSLRPIWIKLETQNLETFFESCKN